MTRFKMTREEVYYIIDGERTYQETKWNEKTTLSNGDHTFEEWIMYIEDYLAEAKHILCRTPKPECDVEAGRIMRKVAALAVAALENNGAEPRR